MDRDAARMNSLGRLLTKWRASKQKSADRANLRAQLMAAVADGKFTKEEIDALYDLQEQLGLTAEDVGSIRVQAFAAAFAAAKQDGHVSEEEERELESIKNHLDLADADILPTTIELLRFRLLREIAGGQVPETSVSGLVLQKAERAFWIEPATMLEERVIDRQYIGGSHGVSIRIMKGVSYRVGAFRGHVETKTGIVPTSSGDLVITSKRVIFRGDRKSFNARLDKLLNIEMASDGVSLTTGATKPKVLQFTNPDNADIVGAILSYAINNFHR